MNLPNQTSPVYRYGASSLFIKADINPASCGGYSTCASMSCDANTCSSYGKSFPNPFNGATGTGQCCANIFTKKGCCCLAGQTVCN